jgi:hypothetical protein
MQIYWLAKISAHSKPRINGCPPPRKALWCKNQENPRDRKFQIWAPLTLTALSLYAAHYYRPRSEPEAFPPGCRVQLPATPLVVRVESGCRLLENSAADPGSGAFLTPGWVKVRSRMRNNIPDHIS